MSEFERIKTAIARLIKDLRDPLVYPCYDDQTKEARDMCRVIAHRLEGTLKPSQ